MRESARASVTRWTRVLAIGAAATLCSACPTGTGTDAGVGVDLSANDLTTPSDSAAAIPDLSGTPDLSIAPDQSVPPDLTAPRDLAVVRDLVGVTGDLAQCTPFCDAIGTRSEGWYDSCTHKLIKWDFCANCTAVCNFCGVGCKSNGFYNSCDPTKFIVYVDCTP